MAEKETKNEPKDLVEPVPEEVEEIKNTPEVEEKIKEMEKKDKEKEEDPTEHWIPKTELGKLVKAKKIKTFDEILEKGKRILEPEISDALLPIESDLIAIGQAKGKFGGGKRRAWRQTQKKTEESNVLSFSAMAVVGDKKGHVGLGFGRAKETLPSREKALRNAKINIIKITRGFETPESKGNEPHTVPFKVQGKSGSCKVTLIPAPRGTGLVIGEECKKILNMAGINDVYSFTKGKTRTTFNFAKACVNALEKTNLIKTR
jgi:small subunit ribosomal protein S5